MLHKYYVDEKRKGSEMSKINTQDYRRRIKTPATAKEAFAKISQVPWWWSKDFEGSSSKPGDVFTVRFKNGARYTIRISQFIPDKKIIWDVIDADQTWHEDRDEWNGTKMIWEISPEMNGSTVTMTHQGLLPNLECYEKCTKGWDYLLNQEGLYKILILGGK